jgi:hypothetical protein
MAVVTIEEAGAPAEARRAELQSALEEGKILYLPRSPIEIPEPDRHFLLSLRQSRAGYHKNIAYRPQSDRVTGFAADAPEDVGRLTDVLRRYSRASIAFLTSLFPGYARHWKVDYASFRALEEEGRDLPLQKKNDLLHVDAFPTRPTRGNRIFRFFTNVNTAQPRRWKTGAEVFPALADRFAVSSGLLDKAMHPGIGSRLRAWGEAAGLPFSARSPYDEFMLRFHDFLKENGDYQARAATESSPFLPAPPGWSSPTWSIWCSRPVRSKNSFSSTGGRWRCDRPTRSRRARAVVGVTRPAASNGRFGEDRRTLAPRRPSEFSAPRSGRPRHRAVERVPTARRRDRLRIDAVRRLEGSRAPQPHRLDLPGRIRTGELTVVGKRVGPPARRPTRKPGTDGSPVLCASVRRRPARRPDTRRRRAPSDRPSSG